jgi:cellulose synthase/poly-beta-1,6-N-acetylglucosamine synthase-like glycosyltransferase
LRKVEENRNDITSLVREITLHNSVKRRFDNQIVFLVRAFNEAQIIQETLNTLIRAGYTDILVVNDGSTDTTDEVLEKF